MKIIVTGTSRGLGKSLAEFLAEKGHTIIGCARSNLETTKFTHVPGVDLNDPSTFSLIKDHLSDADGLVNNAAVAFDGLLATQGEKSIQDIISVNLVGPLLLSKHYVRERLRRKLPGTIVNVSSIISIRGYAGLASYAASKAGLDGMTRSLARELGAKGFRVNSVLPGYMETEMSKDLDLKQKSKIINRTPLGRLAELQDVNPVVEFLLGDSSRFITGQSIVVDGGITV